MAAVKSKDSGPCTYITYWEWPVTVHATHRWTELEGVPLYCHFLDPPLLSYQILITFLVEAPYTSMYMYLGFIKRGFLCDVLICVMGLGVCLIQSIIITAMIMTAVIIQSVVQFLQAFTFSYVQACSAMHAQAQCIFSVASSFWELALLV